LGVFDGMHRGHQALLSHCDALLTFDPHPTTFFTGTTRPKLTTLAELRTYCPTLLVASFNHALASMAAPDFFRALCTQLTPSTLVVGYDYCFGAQKTGTPQLLSSLCADHGINLHVLPPVLLDNTPVKSREIRAALLHGNANHAFRLLGHPYLIQGTVVHGDNRGASLGFPTANLAVPPEKLIPQAGVYAGQAQLPDGSTHNGIVYIGSKPTFTTPDTASFQLEIHLFDGTFSLYNHPLSVSVYHKIRGEHTFASADELTAQIKRDIAQWTPYTCPT